jgi:hypothetical protein
MLIYELITRLYMPNRKKQVGGRKEAPLAIVGSQTSSNAQQEQIYTPNNAEYHRYIKLLDGFFEKLTRWQDMLQPYVKPWERWGENFIAFSILHTSHGFIISPEHTFNPTYNVTPEDDPPNKVLQIAGEYREISDYPDPAINGKHVDFTIEPGPAGEQLLINPEGKPINQVDISVRDNGVLAELEIIIDSTITAHLKPRPYHQYHVRYQLNRQDQTLTVGQTDQTNMAAMSEAFQTQVFDTINRLLPAGSTTATQQPEHGASSETALKKFPRLQRCAKRLS